MIGQILTLGEVFNRLNLAGSTRAGWACMECSSLGTVKELRSGQAAKCSVCGAQFSIQELKEGERDEIHG